MSFRLEMKNMSKAYGTFLANDNVSIAVKKGEVHAIVGENGAGKTTLMRMLYGMENPTGGEILLNGKTIVLNGPNDAIHHGIGMVHQHFMLFPDFTAAENVVIGHEPKRNGFFKRKAAEDTVKKLADSFGIHVRADVKAEKLSIGEQQRVEILKVLHQGADIIILDEPTAVLTPLEVEALLNTVRNLAAQGKTIILITHKLKEVMLAADKITVLRNGKVTGVFNKTDTNANEIAEVMVGRELREMGSRSISLEKVLLQVKDISLVDGRTKPALNKVSFTVHSGEILGIAGVSGNGQSELLQVLSGLRMADNGSVSILGQETTKEKPAAIRMAGLSHIPEDRYLWGAAKEASVEETAFMGFNQKREFRKGPFLNRKLFSERVRDWIRQFDIKAGSLSEKAGNLSGGNLQKLIVARELAQQTPILLAAEPTRGVDIGAMETIHQALIEKRNNGDAILLFSSELSEIMSLSDRILVMYEGEIAGELSRTEATEEAISMLMAGGSKYDSTT